MAKDLNTPIRNTINNVLTIAVLVGGVLAYLFIRAAY